MNAPRWFYVIVAASAVVLSASVAYRMLRPADEWVTWKPDESGVSWIINRRTRQVCFSSQRGSTCVDLYKSPLH